MKQLDPGTGSGGPSVPPPPGFLISPKVGVVGLVVTFALALVAYVALGLYATTEETATTEGVPPVPGPIEHVDDSDLASIIPEDISRELQAELKTWFQAVAADRQPIYDGEPVDEPEWAAHLLSDGVRRRMDRLPPRVFGSLENVPAVLEEPGPYRGTLVNVWARLDRADEVVLRLREGDRDVHRLALTDAAGLPWVATVTAPPPEDVQQGDWVKVVGAFVKLWPQDGRTALHVFSTRAPIASYPPVSYAEPRVEWLEQVRDETPVASKKLEEEPFYGMLNFVRALGVDGYRELRDAGTIDVADLTGTQGATPLVEAPQVWRFRAIRLRVAPLHKEFVVDRSLGENPGNIQAVYRGYVVDDQQRLIHWVTPFGRDQFDFKGARIVDVEGFFFKRRQEAGSNGKAYYLPILIGTDIQAVDLGPVGPSTDPRLIVAIVVAGSIVMLFVFARTWRQSRAAEDAVRERSLRRRQRHAGAAREA